MTIDITNKTVFVKMEVFEDEQVQWGRFSVNQDAYTIVAVSVSEFDVDSFVKANEVDVRSEGNGKDTPVWSHYSVSISDVEVVSREDVEAMIQKAQDDWFSRIIIADIDAKCAVSVSEFGFEARGMKF
jgi:hypothetical protein